MPKAVSAGFSLLLRMAGLFLIYLVLADTTQEPELAVGVFSAVTVGVAATLARRGAQPIRLRLSALLRAPRALPALVLDAFRVSWALFRSIARREPLTGRLRVARYRATSEVDPEDFGRRLLTQWGASVGANRYVIGIDNDRGLLIVHELVPASGPLDPLDLG